MSEPLNFPFEANRHLLQKNLEFLKSHFPGLYNKVMAQYDQVASEILPYYVNDHILHYKIKVSDSVYLPTFSSRNPDVEARRWLSQIQFDETDNLLLMGCGMGYASLALKNMPNAPSTMIMLEVSPASFLITLATVDMEPLMTDTRFKWVLYPNLQEWFSLLAPFAFSVLSNGIKILKWPFASKYFQPVLTQYEHKLNDFIKWAKVNLSTQSRMGELFSAHFFKNLRRIPGALTLSRLKDKFTDFPALIISAGPSLNKNIHQLSRFKEKVLIIAVDTVLGFLIDLDIAPHFVISTDFTDNALSYLKNEIPTHWQRPILVVDTEVFPDTVEIYKSPVLYCGIEGKSMNEMFFSVTGDLGTIPKGLSVAHTAYYVARFMGVTHIAFIGQDLSFSQGQLYFQGASHEVPIAKEKGQVLTVDGWFGQTHTSQSLKIFLDHFEEIFWHESENILKFNATEGGALIAGCPPMILKEWLQKFAFHEGCIDIVAGDKIADVNMQSALSTYVRHKMMEFTQFETVLKDILRAMNRFVLKLNKNQRTGVFEDYTDYQCKLQALQALQEFQPLITMIRDNMVDGLIVQSKRIKSVNKDDSVNHQWDIIKQQIEKDRIYLERMYHAVFILIQQMQDFLQQPLEKIS